MVLGSTKKWFFMVLIAMKSRFLKVFGCENLGKANP
jgi:hypothetical protein